jgi:hypothetical protein
MVVPEDRGQKTEDRKKTEEGKYRSWRRDRLSVFFSLPSVLCLLSSDLSLLSLTTTRYDR